MPYLGNIPAENYASFDKQTITGDGGTSYTLTHPVGSAQEVAIFVNNVRQEPGVAYTVTGTALTMTGNVESTDDFYAIFIGKAVQTVEIPEKATNGDYDFDNGTLFVDASTDRVGVGTTAPDTPLDVEGHIRVTGGSDCDIEFQSGSARRKFIGGDVNDLELGTYSSSNTSRDVHMTINSSGNVGIGTSSPDQTLHVHKGSAGSVSSSANSVLTLEDDGDVILQMLCPSGNSQQIRFGDAADNGIGLIQYDHSDNSMRFNTNGPEKMRLSTNGYLQVGQNTSNNPGQGNDVYGLALRGDGRVFASANGTYSLGLNRSDSGELTNFSRSGDFKGSISISASAVAYNTTSDHRLKQNVVDMTGAITRLKTLKPKRFDFIADAGNTVDGFLAHEAQSVVPEAVTGTHNEVDDDGNAVMQGIDQAKLVPLLTGALKEAIAKIETLETEMTALKARVTTLEDA